MFNRLIYSRLDSSYLDTLVDADVEALVLVETDVEVEVDTLHIQKGAKQFLTDKELFNI